MSVISFENFARVKSAGRRPRVDVESEGTTLEISQSCVYDYALNVLDASKTSGNFAADLEMLLKDLGLFDDVTFTIGPKLFLCDCRRVEFRPQAEVHSARFRQILGAIENCVGYDAESPLWTRLFHSAQKRTQATRPVLTRRSR